MDRTPARTLAAALLALSAGALFAHACASGKAGEGGPGGDGGPDAAVGDSGTPDSGGPDAGLPDAGCTSDVRCGTNRFCEQSSGRCRDAKPCPQGTRSCEFQADPSHPDYCDGQRCYCDPGDQACKPRHAFCAGCALNTECGTEARYNPPADCVPADAGVADQSVCLPRFGASDSCPPGFSKPPPGTGGSYCLPGGGRCGGPGACTADSGCDPHSKTPLCNTWSQLCVGACSFIFKTGESPACPTGQVCHLVPSLAGLPPTDPNYAMGRCGAPCTTATVCGAGLVCRSEGLDHPVQRCGLPPPKCSSDVECPDGAAAHSNGYCDLLAHDCKTDCRNGGDCKAGYLCQNQACVAETCLQAGGADFGCDYGQFCCGEDGGPPCPANTAVGACYDRPAQTWCGTCSANADCTGAGYPSRPGEPNLCLTASTNQKLCQLGCDPGKGSECPRGWDCQTVTATGCKQDSDCGSQSGAHCDKPADGGSTTCTCATDQDCPNDANNITYCRAQKCVFGSVCKPACP